jgi:hypothetical protein
MRFSSDNAPSWPSASWRLKPRRISSRQSPGRWFPGMGLVARIGWRTSTSSALDGPVAADSSTLGDQAGSIARNSDSERRRPKSETATSRSCGSLPDRRPTVRNEHDTTSERKAFCGEVISATSRTPFLGDRRFRAESGRPSGRELFAFFCPCFMAGLGRLLFAARSVACLMSPEPNIRPEVYPSRVRRLRIVRK